MLQLLCFNLVPREQSVFEGGYDGIPPSWRAIKMKDFHIWFMNAWLWDVFEGNLTSEMKVDGLGEHSQRVCMAILGSRDLLEVATG